jgi:hypothetical protein
MKMKPNRLTPEFKLTTEKMECYETDQLLEDSNIDSYDIS